MARVVLIHWNEREGRECAQILRNAGHDPRVAFPGSSADLRPFRNAPPDAFVIDLGRIPSHGRAVAIELRQRKSTRFVPLVFVGGDSDKTTRVREFLPDATYAADWRGIRAALRNALRERPVAPVVPGTMSGYSGTPLPKKLGIRAESTVVVLGAPKGFDLTLGAISERVHVRCTARGKPADRVLLFARSRAELARGLPKATRVLGEGGGLWIVWPKKASGHSTDLTQRDVRGKGLSSGLVDYKICAIDETWSGLLFARRQPAARK